MKGLLRTDATGFERERVLAILSASGHPDPERAYEALTEPLLRDIEAALVVTEATPSAGSPEQSLAVEQQVTEGELNAGGTTMSDQGQTHFVGDDCPGGHQDDAPPLTAKQAAQVAEMKQPPAEATPTSADLDTRLGAVVERIYNDASSGELRGYLMEELQAIHGDMNDALAAQARRAAALDAEYDAVGLEGTHRNPEVLIRHIRGNDAATMGFYQSSGTLWKRRAEAAEEVALAAAEYLAWIEHGPRGREASEGPKKYAVLKDALAHGDTDD